MAYNGFEEAVKAQIAQLQGVLTVEHRIAVRALEAKVQALEAEKEGAGKRRRSLPSVFGASTDLRSAAATRIDPLDSACDGKADIPSLTLPGQPLSRPPMPDELNPTPESARSSIAETCRVGSKSIPSLLALETTVVDPEGCEVAVVTDSQVLPGCGSRRTSFAETNNSQTDVGLEEKFQVLPEWSRECFRTQSKKLRRSATFNDFKSIDEQTDDVGEDYVPGPLEHMMQWYVVQPNSAKRLCWECLSLFLILVDILVVPLNFLNPPRNGLMLAAVWGARVFWTLDIVCSFFTGYVCQNSESMVELRPLLIARKYLRTRFPVDCVIVACDWLEVAAGSASSNDTSTLRFMLLLRVVRVFRLARFAKTRNFMDFVVGLIRSEVAMIILYVFGLLFCWVLLIHVVACVWYAIHGDGSHEGGEAGYSEWNPSETLAGRYMVSFHYVLALFVGEQLTQPRNLPEYAFSTIVLAFAFMVSASFVGSLTTAMTRLQVIASRRSAQFAALTRYLADCGISRRLSLRVQRNARYAFRERKRNTPESSVELFQLISDPLQAEIHYEVHSPLITRHPFFFLYNKVNPTGMRHICHTTVSEVPISRGDVLFSQYEVPVVPRMYFVANGRLVYYTRTDREHTKVSPRQWISEAVLWTAWAHRGSVIARAECQLLAIDAKRFVNITSGFQTQHPNAYAARFVHALNDARLSALAPDLGEDTDRTRILAAEAFKEVDGELPVGEDWTRRRRSSLSTASGMYSQANSSLSSYTGGLLGRVRGAVRRLFSFRATADEPRYVDDGFSTARGGGCY